MKGLALLGTVAAIALTALPASAAEPPLLVVAFSKVGGMNIRGATPAKAAAVFGKPAKTTEHVAFCELNWVGLRMTFYTLFDDKQCAAKTPFDTVTVTRNWITDRGLRKGDSVAKAKALYPAARKAKPGARNLDLVVRFSQAVGPYGLTARARGGRVVALDIYDPQGGE